VDPLLERAKADSLALELEALSQSLDWHQVVVALDQLPRSRDCFLAKRKVWIDGRHGRNSFGWRLAMQSASRLHA
jgi:hypothetical protein